MPIPDILIAFIVLIASWPAGYMLKSLTEEELKPGKKYFQLLWITSFALAIIFLILPLNDLNVKKAVIFTLLFMANVAFISWK